MLTPDAFNDLLMWAITHNVTTDVAGAVMAAAFNADFRDRHSLPAQTAPESKDASLKRTGDTSHSSRPPSLNVLDERAGKPGETGAIAGATDAIAPATSEPAWRKRREELRKRGLPAHWRGRLANVAIAPAIALAIAPPLSLSLKDSALDSDERVKGIGGSGERGAKSESGLMALPADWQPTAKNQALAVELHGEIGAENILAKFRDHYSDDPRLRTARQWQRLYRDTWVMKEKPDGKPQRSLPLVAAVKPPPEPPADPLWQPVYARLAASYGEDVARSWFRDCCLTVDGETATVTVATKFMAHALTGSYEGPVLRAIAAGHPAVTRVRFVARGGAGNLPTAPAADPAGPPVAQTG